MKKIYVEKRGRQYTAFRARVERQRKEQARRLKKVAICAALIGIAAISIGMASRPADTHIVETVYTVRPGDTWWGIVEHFRNMDVEDRYVLEYKNELEKLNKGINLVNLTPGQKLRIRYHRKDGE